jgi:cytochrome P450
MAVIREAMRLHPSNCYPLERVAPAGGAQICGQFVPAGTVVSTMASLMNRTKSIYGDDADSFRPERWLEAGTEQLKAMDRTYFTVSSSLFILAYSYTRK